MGFLNALQSHHTIGHCPYRPRLGSSFQKLRRNRVYLDRGPVLS